MRTLVCEICGPHDDDVAERHADSLQHRLNYHLELREVSRKLKLNCDKIFVHQQIRLAHLSGVQVQYFEDTGVYVTNLQCDKFEELQNKLEFEFLVRNDRPDQQWIIVQALHPLEKYFLTDFNPIPKRRLEFVLENGEKCKFLLTFQQDNFTMGKYTLPIAITVQPAANPIAYKVLYRDVEITIGDFTVVEDTEEASPFCNEKWPLNMEIQEPTNQPKYLENFHIISEYFRVYMHCFKTFKGEAGLLQQYRLDTLRMWENGVNISNYAEYFHRLLWLEECTQLMGILQYNMTRVRVRVVRSNVILKVPGLAEKRPSVMKGDLVLLRLSNERRAYKGVVELVEDEQLTIEYLAPELLTILSILPDTLFDVSFLLSRLQLERMHNGVDLCVKNGMLHTTLFPVRPLNRVQRRSLGPEDLFNPTIALNPQQLIAVESILSCTSQKAPYIIFGPPGTGKTVTLVEAILQIKRHYPNKNILVCAPSNAACDMLALKLDDQIKGRQKKDLFRVHTCNRIINDVPTAVKYFSNIDGGEFYMVKPSDLKSYTIVISTLHLIGKFSGSYVPDMLFIDEAAQTTEPECDIPIGLLAPGMPIVLAGDPRQLGPVIGVPSARHGLAKSLLDRLMETIELYSPTRQRPLEFNNDFITMLVHNYRSHADIVTVPNKLFYGDSLQFNIHNDEISNMSIAGLVLQSKNKKKKMRKGAAVEFIGLLSKEQRQGHSPSYYNEIEIDMVLKLIDRMLNLTNVRVIGSDIGVIAPYIRQVCQIRNKLNAQGRDDIQVGTTEAFQGGERRIIIISTVRAQSDLLLYDKKYDLGFVKHERRFNVAITRAQAKLIIVGNPHVLAYDDKCWGAMMEHCKQLDSYYGEDVQRDETTRYKIMQHFHAREE